MTERLVAWDSVGGASGDMMLAALLDLGVEIEELLAVLRGLAVSEPFDVQATPVVNQGMRGLQVSVRTHAHSHTHRGLSDILSLIQQSRLPPPVQERASQVFQRLAKAEATIHALPIEKIHFHEVGGIDAIVDIVGVCWLLHRLGVTGHRISPLPLGHGVIQCAHGCLPSPAPATLELLKGFPVVQVDEPHELVTPTGAALLTTLASGSPPASAWQPVRIGYGFGHRILKSRPNLLRATLLDPTTSDPDETAECWMLECNLDNANPEWIGNLTRLLMDAGALDVHITAIQMKKQRPGQLISALCASADVNRLQELIFREVPTLGIRRHPVHRTTLERRFIPVETPFGPVRIKCGYLRGRRLTASPEFEDCRQLADRQGIAVRQVYEAALKACPEEAAPPSGGP